MKILNNRIIKSKEDVKKLVEELLENRENRVFGLFRCDKEKEYIKKDYYSYRTTGKGSETINPVTCEWNIGKQHGEYELCITLAVGAIWDHRVGINEYTRNICKQTKGR